MLVQQANMNRQCQDKCLIDTENVCDFTLKMFKLHIGSRKKKEFDQSLFYIKVRTYLVY